MYSKKFDEFQGTVSKSNSVYSGFKQDMDKVRTVLSQLDDIGKIMCFFFCKNKGKKNKKKRDKKKIPWDLQ